MNNKHLIKLKQNIYDTIDNYNNMDSVMDWESLDKDMDRVLGEAFNDLINKFSEIIGEYDELPENYYTSGENESLDNAVKRMVRNDFRKELRAKLSQLEDLQSKEVKE